MFRGENGQKFVTVRGRKAEGGEVLPLLYNIWKKLGAHQARKQREGGARKEGAEEGKKSALKKLLEGGIEPLKALIFFLVACDKLGGGIDGFLHRKNGGCRRFD